MNTKRRSSRVRKSTGATAVFVAIVLVVLVGMLALAIDVGYVAMTKTQLQAISDAATLSGGTEIMPGLRRENTQPKATVVTNGTAVAVDYANNHPNGNIDVANDGGTYVDANRDVRFGTGIYNPAATPPRWEMFWGKPINDPAIPEALRGGIDAYNMIGVTVRRDVDASTNNDQPLPLMFAHVIGNSYSHPAADSAAVVMPAKGIRIIPGGSEKANVMPFALDVYVWRKYLAAQLYLDHQSSKFPNEVGHPGGQIDLDYVTYKPPTVDVKNWPDSYSAADINVPYTIRTTVPDPNDVNNPPLFGYYKAIEGQGNQYAITRQGVDANGNPQTYAFVRDVWDNFDADCPNGCTPLAGPDYVVEISLYPRLLEEGNFGTIDIGAPGNSTAILSDQIDPGVSDQHLSYYSTDNGFNPPYQFPPASMNTGGDTGISASIGTQHESALDASIGKCKAMFLFESISLSGNNKTFRLLPRPTSPEWPTGTLGMSPIVGIVVLEQNLTSNNKRIMIQACSATLIGGVGDIDEPINEETTVFTPLILIE